MTALLRMLSAALLALAGEVHADAPTAPPVGSACVEVVVNGERVPDYNCLSRQLSAPAAATAPAPAPAQLTAAERLARQPPSALGLANRAATQQRMGNAFGVSTQPQRPPPPPPPRAFP